MNSLKQKYLGQYFSGSAVARLLFELIDTTQVYSAIDPMCGSGDLLVPFVEKEISVVGNEVDLEAVQMCQARMPHAEIWNSNSFSINTLSRFNKSGYDLVITNPPYVRYQLQANAKEYLSHEWLLIDDIIRNLKEYTESTKSLNEGERQLIIEELGRISGLSDLAVPSWILCMMLVKNGGQLAIVLPTTWLTREYSAPVKNILSKLFEIDYVVNDANSTWFSGKAQVKTSLLLAHRKTKREKSWLSYVDLYKLAGTKSCLTANLPSTEIRDLFSNEIFIDNRLSVRMVSQDAFIGSSNDSSWLSLLSRLANKDSLIKIGENKIEFGQGLRTGANSFFYVQDPQCESKYYLDVIQNQRSLGTRFTTNAGSCKLLYIQDSVTNRDFSTLEPKFAKHYKSLPYEISEYIERKSQEKKGEILLPELSSVRTNITKSDGKRPPRFWYMLPPLTQRHTAKLFLPRVNGDKPIVRYNSNALVVDANFITIWPSNNSRFNEYSLLALLNSTWCSVQFEELGSVMGGGALKLDAAQIRNILIPYFSDKDIDALSSLGKKLARQQISNKSVIVEIDSCILQAMNTPDINWAMEQLEIYRQYHINQRRHERNSY